MLDLSFIREHPEEVRKAIRDKNGKADAEALVNSILEEDRSRRKMLAVIEDLRNRRNKASQEIAALKSVHREISTLAREMRDARILGRPLPPQPVEVTRFDNLIEEMRQVADDIRRREGELAEVERELKALLLRVPNIPASGVPVGHDDSANLVVRTWGTRRTFDFQPKTHWELGAELGILDFERATKMSGTGFVLHKNEGALLERALYNFMLDLHTREHNYKEVFPPYLVSRETMTGTGQLPKLEEDMYHLEVDDLFLIPTAEVPLTNLHKDEILFEADLPLYYTAYTACFRREAGSYGRETRGMVRVHQFNKVELVKLVAPEKSDEELQSLVRSAERVLELLGLEYRVRLLCTGEMSFAASICYDLEAWAPGVERWLEVSSCSNFGDFQARRINIRYRDSKGRVRFVHTLNGSGLALPRTMIAILESEQNPDGSVNIPEALWPYTGGLKVIRGKK